MKKLFVTLMIALFATVVFGQTSKNEMTTKDLPVCVEKYVHQNYPGYTIDKSYRLEKGAVVTYEVTIISKEKPSQVLIFDAICKNVKKVKPDDGTVKPKPKPKPDDGTAKPKPTDPDQTAPVKPKK
jgi:hypothetical protein